MYKRLVGDDKGLAIERPIEAPRRRVRRGMTRG